MRLVWYLWPINFILGAIVMVSLTAALWVLGLHIRRLFQMRGDGLRMRDLICLNLEIEEVERSVRHFRERQQDMFNQLHELAKLSSHSETGNEHPEPK